MAQFSALRRTSSSREISFSGAVHPMVLLAAFAFFSSAVSYLYAINLGATQGYETRKYEQEISELRKENGKLRVTEAELRSLGKIEEATKERDMIVPDSPTFIGGHGQVAFR